MNLRLVTEAEDYVKDVASNLTTPGERECVLCFVNQMVMIFGCDDGLRWVKHWRDLRSPRATALERRLESKGGFCDCEVVMNAFEGTRPGAEDEMAVAVPECLGVSRQGSSRPCDRWRAIRNFRYFGGW